MSDASTMAVGQRAAAREKAGTFGQDRRCQRIAAAAATLGGRDPMGATTDKIKGKANDAAGNVKQAAGKAMDKPGLEAKGKAQEIKGKAQGAIGKGKDAVKKAVDQA